LRTREKIEQLTNEKDSDVQKAVSKKESIIQQLQKSITQLRNEVEFQKNQKTVAVQKSTASYSNENF